jgi:prolyl oligopeptidase
MTRIITLIVTISTLFACSNNDSKQAKTDNIVKPVTPIEAKKEDHPTEMKYKYPKTHKGEVVDTYFDSKVEDPYRWLEDDMSEETAAWVKSQNQVTQTYLKEIPYRESIEKRLTELWNYEKVSAPFKEGDYTYYYKNDGLQNQYVIYRSKAKSKAEVFLDPNTFSKDGTVSLSDISFSKDSKYAAYSISEGGSDWRKLKVIDVESKEQIEDQLVDVKFSGLSWKGSEGFYYSSYDKPEGSELSAKTDPNKLYYHKLRTKHSEDKVLI